MKSVPYAALAVAALALGGCITATDQMRLAEDRAVITTRGNAFASPEQVQRNLYTEAAKLTLASGFEWFVIEQSRDVTENSFMMAPASGSATASGNAYGWGGNANYTGASITPYSKPGMQVGVRFGKGARPDGALDAAFILAQKK